MNGVVKYLKIEHLICFIWFVHWQVLFLDFDHIVIKLFSAYNDLSLLKFGSGDFILFPCWNHRIQRTMIIFM
jgi:hypothetical protein